MPRDGSRATPDARRDDPLEVRACVEGRTHLSKSKASRPRGPEGLLCGLFLGILRIFNQRRRIAVKDIGVGTWWRQHKYVANRDCCLPSGFAQENPAALEACAVRFISATRSFAGRGLF